MGKNINKLQVVVPAGEVLFDEGETTKEMYILLKGCVEVVKGDAVVAYINASGSFIGEMATLLDAPRTAMVRTKDKSVMLKVMPEDVDVLFKVTPELGYNLSKSLAERLAIMTEKAMAAGGAAPAKEEEDEKASKEEIAEAEKEMEEEKEVPESEEDIVKFLTRTEVHKDVFRYYFNHLGETENMQKIIDGLLCPDMLIKLILAEYQKCELVQVGEGSIEYLFNEKLHEQAEEWVFSNGLFRHAC